MDKKIPVLIAVILIALIAFLLLRPPAAPSPEQPAEKAELRITTFHFNEAEFGPGNFTATKNERTVGIPEAPPSPDLRSATFNGPIQKPTPCNGLNATYTISGNDIIVNIETLPYKDACIQVIADTFYNGYFFYFGDLDQLIVNYNGQELGRI